MELNSRLFPERPGVYLFRSARGRVLYVGKARNLQKRLSQHWQKRHEPVLASLFTRSAEVHTVVTPSERDALLLEHSLVQQHQPPFNIRLKDDKSYPLLELTLADEWPGIYFVRKRRPGSFLFGPLGNAARARELIDLVTRLFRLRQCSPAPFRQGKPCLYFHIGRCSAPCAGRISPPEYKAAAEAAAEFLKGKVAPLRRALKTRMTGLASELRFEEAEQARLDLELIRAFEPKSRVVSPAAGSYEVLALLSNGHDSAATLFSVQAGKVRESAFYSLRTVASLPEEVLSELLLNIHARRPLPAEIVVPFLPQAHQPLQELLSAQAGRKVRIHVPRRGIRRNLLTMARENLLQHVARGDYDLLGRRLQDLLKLSRFPRRIEGYDISHTGEQKRVGAMVAFESGQPRKRNYRSFIIRSADPGDPQALAEVLERRLKSPLPFPDLLLIDGGKPQLASALEVVKRLGVESDVIALAKGEERVYLPDSTSLVPLEGSPELHLLQNVRDEAHRRAISHHRKRREALPRRIRPHGRPRKGDGGRRS